MAVGPGGGTALAVLGGKFPKPCGTDEEEVASGVEIAGDSIITLASVAAGAASSASETTISGAR